MKLYMIQQTLNFHEARLILIVYISRTSEPTSDYTRYVTNVQCAVESFTSADITNVVIGIAGEFLYPVCDKILYLRGRKLIK